VMLTITSSPRLLIALFRQHPYYCGIKCQFHSLIICPLAGCGRTEAIRLSLAIYYPTRTFEIKSTIGLIIDHTSKESPERVTAYNILITGSLALISPLRIDTQ
jgi:hypothetical protein